MVMAAIHPRTLTVQKADQKLESYLTELAVTMKLTEAELLSILARQVSNVARYVIRAERHPNNPEKTGDEA